MKHLLTAAIKSGTFPDDIPINSWNAFKEGAKEWYAKGIGVWQAGILLEQMQAKKGHKSAFGVEDLPSNNFGLMFESHIDYKNLCYLPIALEHFINSKLGGLAAPPVGKIKQFNLIRNFSSKPVLSVNDKDLRVDEYYTYIKYKSGMGQYYERTWLDIMFAAGIGPLNPGGDKADSFPY